MSFNQLDKYIVSCTTEKKIAGVVCWVGTSKNTLFFKAVGHAQLLPGKAKINKNTIFDLASLTKPLATALAIMLLYEKKQLKLNDKVKMFFPIASSCPIGQKTVEQLLTHTAGLPAWFPLYILPEQDRLKYLIESTSKTRTVLYSCLGYIILGMIIEKISSQSLDKFCKKQIFKPLGLNNTMFGPVKKKNVAATEFGNKHEEFTAAQHGIIKKMKWRNYVLKGEVHDGNSYYVYKGVSGNAGLFSTAQEIAKILRAYIAGNIVTKKTVRMMIQNHTNGKEKRGFGWIIDPFPEYVSNRSFYHTGFTGTMCLVDPIKDIIIVFLTNAVHPVVRQGLMPEVRQRLVEITAKATA
ncbi:MAG: serine hydrolase [bacterium]